MSRDVNPQDIPEEGERYDFVLDKIGYKNLKTEKPTEIVVKAVIDNGEYRGHRVSHAFPTATKADEEEFLDFCFVLGTFPGDKDGPREYLKTVKTMEKKARFSAVLNFTCWTKHEKHGWKQVEMFYEGNYSVHYELSDFDKARGEAEYKLSEDRASKFER